MDGEEKEVEVLTKTKNWLTAYFQKRIPTEKIPIKLIGTPFQKEVWHYVEEIPYGIVWTYKDIAMKVATKRKKTSNYAQAVGQAIHNNPIPIIIPCHRVVGQNKNLVGYGLGIEKKITLLELEGIAVENYSYKQRIKKYDRIKPSEKK